MSTTISASPSAAGIIDQFPSSKQLKVLVVAFSARNALQQNLDAMFKGIGPLVDYGFMLPTNYHGRIPEPTILRIECGTTKAQGALASINPRSHLQTIAAVRRFKPDVVHLYTGEGYFWACTLAAMLKVARIPLVVTLHDPDPHPGSFYERLNKWVRSPVLASASAIHLYSASHLDRVAQMLPGKPVTVIAHGSQAEPFLQQRQPGIARERLILFFGRLEYYKGIDILCQAVLMLPQDVRLAIAGPGNLRENELALIKQLGDRVEVHNAMLDEAQVANLMQRAAIMALPYRHVTQSSVPAIAASFGLPLVASALGHFVEEVPALHGLLVPPEDPAALAAGLAVVLENPPLDIPQPATFADLAPAFASFYRSVIVKGH